MAYISATESEILLRVATGLGCEAMRLSDVSRADKDAACSHRWKTDLEEKGDGTVLLRSRGGSREERDGGWVVCGFSWL